MLNVAAPQWRLEILAGVKSQLRSLGFRGSRARYWKVIGDRVLSVQLSGGSDPHDTQKLSMIVFMGVDFLDVTGPLPKGEQPTARVALWSCRLPWVNSLGNQEFAFRAYSHSEALEVLEAIKSALPVHLTKIELRFQTWHDVLIYMDKDIRTRLDPPGKVHEWRLPKVS